MKALTLHGDRDLRYETVAEPQIEQPSDVIVAVELCGVCGSDLHPYFGRETGYDPGTVQGHEFVGRVVALGKDVQALAIDDRVHCPFTTSCGVCHYCRTGLSSRCPSGQLFGWREGGRGLHGGQAELVRVPLADATLLRIPEGIGDIEALLMGDVLATGYYCAQRGEVFGRTVAVVGCGPVGLMAIVSALELGAERVLAFDPVASRRAVASSFGAEAVMVSAAEPELVRRELDDLLGDVSCREGVDVVLEAVGSPSSARLAFDLLRPGGVLSAVGVHTAPQFPFSPMEAYDRNLTLRVGRCPARSLMQGLVPLVRSGRHDLAGIVTDRLELSQGPEAYERFAERRDGCLKVVLAPE